MEIGGFFYQKNRVLHWTFLLKTGNFLDEIDG